MREISLFTGAGGGLLGGLLLGWEPVQFVENDPFCGRVLAARFPGVPLHDDVRTFHPEPGSADVVSGGFPCQPHSAAGLRLGGLDDRDLWPDTVRVLRESRAPLGFFENVPGLLTSLDADGLPYFGRLLGDLSEIGFDVEWTVLSAADVGAPHRRDRLWILAHSPRLLEGRQVERPEWERARPIGEPVADAEPDRRREGRRAAAVEAAGDGPSGEPRGRREVADAAGGRWRPGVDPGARGGEPARQAGGRGRSPWWIDPADVEDPGGDGRDPRRAKRARLERRNAPLESGLLVDARGRRYGTPEDALRAGRGGAELPDEWVLEPGVGRVAHGVAERVHRLRALGNGQVPQSMACAFSLLARRAGLL